MTRRGWIAVSAATLVLAQAPWLPAPTATQPAVLAPLVVQAPSAEVRARIEAAGLAKSTGRRVAIDELTTERQRVWALPDGRYESEIAAGAVRAKRSGQWVDADLTLRRRPDGTVAPGVHLAELVLAGARPLGNHEFASIVVDGGRRATRWSGPLPE